MRQREMPMLGEARRPKLAPWELVHACKDMLAAVHLCIQLSGFMDYVVAERLGIDPSICPGSCAARRTSHPASSSP